MFFNSVQEMNRLRRLLSKEISNISLKVNIEKKWHTQSLTLKAKNDCLHVSFWGPPTHPVIFEFSNFLLHLKNQRPGSKTV